MHFKSYIYRFENRLRGLHEVIFKIFYLTYTYYHQIAEIFIHHFTWMRYLGISLKATASQVMTKFQVAFHKNLRNWLYFKNINEFPALITSYQFFLLRLHVLYLWYLLKVLGLNQDCNMINFIGFQGFYVNQESR